jgi:ribosomal protein S18 acetylase RimI-like enzyme
MERSDIAMQSVTYKTDLRDVDWAALKATLRADAFDNGRSVAQYQRSFEQSHATCIAYSEGRIVGTARTLSDGVCNAYVVDVWTLSRYRRRGIARTMMRHLLQHLDGQHVYLSTDDAAAFYTTLGFEEQPTGMGQVVGTWLVNE